MRKNFITLFILSLLLFSCNYKKENLPKKQDLFWSYSDSIDAKIWEPALTPGSIHLALSNNLFLAKDFYFDHYTEKIKWLSHKNWFYKTNLNLDEQTYKKQQIWLLLPGIDTYSKIYINGRLVASTNDFFNHYALDIKKHLHPGKNQIIVQFLPPIEETKKIFKSLKTSGSINPLSILRKPYFHFNNTLGSNYIPVGFSRQPQILLWDKVYLQNVTFSFYNITRKKANAIAQVTIYSSELQNATIQIKSQFALHVKKRIKLKPGKNTLSLKFTIKNPRLWFPYKTKNYQPEIYKFTTNLFIKKAKYAEHYTYTGIRKIHINTSSNKLTVHINDSTILLRAARIYPLRVNIIKENDLYERFIKLIKQAGFNTIITSDKGWYHNQRFYNLCDQEGIMVIQTLPIAYKIFPDKDTFVNLLLDETKQNIHLLANHPSIIAWNGAFNPQAIRHAPQNIKTFASSFFTQISPTLIHTVDSTRPYIRSLNFQNIINIKHNFISLPNQKLVYKFFSMQDPLDKKIDLTLSFFTKPKPQLYFPLKKLITKTYQTDSLSSFYYFSQIIQKQRFEKYLRSLNPSYQSHIIVNWFNDITPALSPTFIDYSLRPKAKYYSLKKYLGNFRINAQNNGNNVEVILTSSYDTAHVLAYYKIYDFHGHLLWQKVQNEAMVNHSVSQVFDLGIYFKLFSRDSILMKIEVYNNLELVAEKYHYFIDQSKIHLQDPELNVLYYPVDEGYAIEITANKYLAKDIHIMPTINKATVDNNFFDILPGESKIVVISVPIPTENFGSFIKVFSMYDYLTGRINNINYKIKIQQKEFQQVNE